MTADRLEHIEDILDAMKGYIANRAEGEKALIAVAEMVVRDAGDVAALLEELREED